MQHYWVKCLATAWAIGKILGPPNPPIIDISRAVRRKTSTERNNRLSADAIVPARIEPGHEFHAHHRVVSSGGIKSSFDKNYLSTAHREPLELIRP